MANPLKQLAGETAIYGLSTILARVINFLFVPFYTRLLTTASYGVVTEFMAYIAVLQVVLVLGLETGCFRFANREGFSPRAVYSNAFVAVLAVNAVFLALMTGFAGPIASMLGYDGYENCIMYVGGILFLDCVTAILFAKYRQEHKALRFAIFKTIKILTETGSDQLCRADQEVQLSVLLIGKGGRASRNRCRVPCPVRRVAAAFRFSDPGFHICDICHPGEQRSVRTSLCPGIAETQI